ncbi:MAG: nucleotidyltransferase family protein [bacterium]|nr:nucleotidyltransferase family protein [bacterium]
MTPNQISKILKSLKDEARKRYKVELKGFFGSYARGKVRKDSDIDILADFQKGATLLDLSGLGNFLEEKLQHKVDVVSQRAVREQIRSYIYRDMVYL